MGDSKNTRVLPLRIPHELADRVEAEAAELGLRRNDVLTRRLEGSYSRANGNRKTVESGSEAVPEIEVRSVSDGE